MLKFENPLREYFENNVNNKLVHKWLHYFDIYHRHFQKFRGKSDLKILEFGVFQGGSLEMWRNYFGDKAKIYGIDIDPKCKSFESDTIEIFIGDQEDPEFLQQVMQQIGNVDLVIEDGGHTMAQQITTFEEVYKYVNIDGGIFLTEDTHTSYWQDYGGGYRKPDSFIEYTKKLIDKLNAWHSLDKNELAPDEFTYSTKSIHFYDSVVVFEKGKIERPYDRMMGKWQI